MGGMTAYNISEQNKAAQQQQEAVASTTRLNYALKQQQEQELKAKAGMDLTQEAIKRTSERGRIQASQAESGVAGASPLREIANSYLQQSLTVGSIVSGEEAALRGIGLENISTYNQSLSQINQLEAQKTTGLDAALQVAISAGAGYLTGGALGGAGASTVGAGSSLAEAGAGSLIDLSTGASVSLSATEAAALGTVPSGYSFAASGSLFGLTGQQAALLGNSLGSYSKK